MMHHFEQIREYAGGLLNNGILDVGSGRGSFLIEAARLGYKVSGVEINPEKVDISLEKLRKSCLFADVYQGVAEKLPFKNESFGFVNCCEVTEHVQNSKTVLEEIHRVLLLGGKAYISFHNRFGFYDQHFHLFGINWLPRTWADFLCLRTKKMKKYNGLSGAQLLGEMHYFTYFEITHLLKTIGFSIQDTREMRIKKIFHNKIMKYFALFVYRIYRATLINTFHVIVTK